MRLIKKLVENSSVTYEEAEGAISLCSNMGIDFCMPESLRTEVRKEYAASPGQIVATGSQSEAVQGVLKSGESEAVRAYCSSLATKRYAGLSHVVAAKLWSCGTGPLQSNGL